MLSGIVTGILSLISLALGAAGVRWPAEEYRWFFEWVVYLSLLAALMLSLWAIWSSRRSIRIWISRVEPSHVILLGLLIAAGGLVWQFYRGTAVPAQSIASLPSVVPAPPTTPNTPPSPPRRPYLQSDAEVLAPALRKMHDILYAAGRDTTSVPGVFAQWQFTRMRRNRILGLGAPQQPPPSAKDEIEPLKQKISELQSEYQRIVAQMGEIFSKNPSYRDDLAPYLNRANIDHEFAELIREYMVLLNVFSELPSPLPGEAADVLHRFNQKIASRVSQQYEKQNALRLEIEAKIREIRSGDRAP